MTGKEFLFIFLILVIGIVLLSYSQNMKKTFKNESLTGLERTSKLPSEIVNESDLEHLPSIVQKYLRYVGVVGKEKVYNMRVVLEGRIRSKPEDSWMRLTSKQYSFFDNPTRVFYIKATKAGIPALGLHLYKNEKASFVVKLLGLIKVVDAKGDKLNHTETVTVFNDMCLLAPATLINEKIQWNEIDSLTVDAKFTNGNITISARLFFNKIGELINFVSNDRFDTDGKEYTNYPWLTPIKKYNQINGYKLCSEISTDYQRPDTTFSYGEFKIKEIEYNCKEFR
jgi:hypothetical protein